MRPQVMEELENAARDATIAIVIESSRELLRLNQTRAGMTPEASQQNVNAAVNEAYEVASRTSDSELERYKAVHAALKSEISIKSRRSPLMTEAQAQQLARDASRWAPDRMQVTEHGEALNMDDKIINALKGR